MKKYIIKFICDLEGYKVAIKQLHWAAENMSQHKLCDDIADELADYQDKVSEVEQSMGGRFPINQLVPSAYEVHTLDKFVKDVISNTNAFYDKLKDEGKNYIGMRSDTEAFLAQMQRFSYLVDFTIKEGLKKRLRDRINESEKLTVSNGRDTYHLTENELREIIREAISRRTRRLR